MKRNPGRNREAKQPAAAPQLAPLAVSVSGAAKLCSVSRTMYYILMKRGEAPTGLRIGARRLIRVSELERWLAKLERGA